MGYQRGAFSRIPIRWNEQRGTLEIGRREGSWPGMPVTRLLRIRWMIPGRPLDLDAKADREITYTGQAVTLSGAAAKEGSSHAS